MISAIVLAAGMSRRMGENKLLRGFSGKTMLEATLDHILASGVEEVVVVLGHDADRLRPLLQDRPVKTVFNPDYATGMTASIQAGIRAAAPAADGFMICLSDMPLIGSETYRLIQAVFSEKTQLEKRLIVQPAFENTAGNPVIFSAVFKNELLALEFPEGCKPVVQHNRDCLVRVETRDNAVLRDADTPEDFESLLNSE